MADYTNNGSLFEFTRTYDIWQIELSWIANCLPNLPKFCPARVLCFTIFISSEVSIAGPSGA